MSDLARLKASVDGNESFESFPYLDSEHLWTFATGRCLETHPLSGAEWKYLLDNELVTLAIKRPGADWLEMQQLVATERQLAHDYDFWPRLNDARQNALVEMAYQMGVDKEEGFHDAIRAIREERWHDAEVAMLDSKWARQTPPRAARIAQQLSSGLFP